MSGAATRRGFLAGAIASTTLPALASAADAPVAPMKATRRTVRRGRAVAVSHGGGRIVVGHDRRRTIAILTPQRKRQKLVDVGGQPVAVAISPDGTIAAVTTASWDHPSLVIVDIRKGTVRTRTDAGPAPGDVAFTPAGDRIVVAGGEQEGTLHVYDAHSFKLTGHGQIGQVPRGIAITPDGRSAWVALNAEARVVRVDLHRARVTRTVQTPWLPDRVAVSPDSKRLLVSHGGRDSAVVSEIELSGARLHRHDAGRLPSAVAWTARGRRLVALAGSGELLVLGARRPRRHVGGAPIDLAVSGEKAFTVDSLSGAVRGVKL